MKLIRRGAVKLVKSARREARIYYAEREDISKSYGVAGSTFRSYKGFKIGPSVVFKEWVEETGLSSRTLRDIEKLESYEEYKKLHMRLFKSLNTYWKKRQRRSLTVAQSFKLLDLFFKAVSRREDQNPIINKNLVKYGHIPLDKYSLLAVKDCFSGIVISNNPSMGDIKDIKTYEFIQEQIRDLMNTCNLPNLYFDYLAWNLEH